MFITEQLIEPLNPCQSCKVIEIKEDLTNILLQAETHRRPSESVGKVYFSGFLENNEFLKLLFRNLDITVIRFCWLKNTLVVLYLGL